MGGSVAGSNAEVEFCWSTGEGLMELIGRRSQLSLINGLEVKDSAFRHLAIACRDDDDACRDDDDVNLMMAVQKLEDDRSLKTKMIRVAFGY